jgi:hypothetical protein
MAFSGLERSCLAARWICALFLVASAAQTSAATSDVRIGVYYYPGWSPDIPMAAHKLPWEPIRAFPGRMPAIGEYRDDSAQTLRIQLDQMKAGGLSYIVFDSYVGPGGTVRSDQAIKAYMVAATGQDLKFAIMWDDSDKFLTSVADWDTIVGFWIDRYLRDFRYLKVEGQPALFIFSAEKLDSRAAVFGSSGEKLIARAQELAKLRGLPGIFFVAGTGPTTPMGRGLAKQEGYGALSQYDLGTSGLKDLPGTGFARRDAGYRKYWGQFESVSTLPTILPISAGWDRKPWGGSVEDGAIPTPKQFKSHVRAALFYLRAAPSEAGRMGTICCWNEYGEGSILEPTKQYGDAYLKGLKAALDVGR